MALSAQQQILELIKKSKTILIIFKKDWTGDALASSLALAEIFKKIDKQVDIVCQNFKATPLLSFLPTALIGTGLNNLQKFIISIDTSRTPVGEFYYDDEKEKLNIYITPKEGKFNPQNVSMATSDYKYDLIFVINSPDLESLDQAYEQNSDFFFTTPKINIDHSNRNEYFGDVDLVDLTSVSTAEIIYNLISKIDENLITDDIATYLLAGIIMATKNFKIPHLPPQTLNIASLLVAKGGRREQIIQHLYQTRFLSTLKLWGRVLSRLNNDLDDKLVWSSISAQDFLETSTTPAEIIDVIDELIVSMPKIEIIVLLYEIKQNGNNKIKCIVYSVKNINSLIMTKKFDPQGNAELAKFSLPDVSLAEAERMVIEEIKQKLPQS